MMARIPEPPPSMPSAPDPPAPKQPGSNCCPVPTRHDRSAPLRMPDAEVGRLFQDLAAEWRTRTAIDSSIQRKVLDPAYQRIIGMGPQVVPYILDDLARSPDHWFWALTALVGQDMAAGQISVSSAAQAWLAWGRDAGVIE